MAKGFKLSTSTAALLLMLTLSFCIFGSDEIEPYNPTQIKYKLNLALNNAFTEPEKSLSIINESIAKAEKAKDRNSIHLGYITKGKFFFTSNQADEAIISLNQAYVTALENGIEVQVHEATRLLSEVHLSKHIKVESLEYLYRGLELSQQLKDTLSITWYLIQIPEVEQELGNIVHAMEFALVAKLFFENNGDSINLANTLLTMGVIHNKLGNYPLSRFNNELAISIFKEKNDSLLISKAKISYSKLLLSENNLNDAERYCKDAIVMVQNLNKLELYKSKSLLGEIYTATKNYSQAMELLLETSLEQKLANDIAGLSLTKLRLASLYTRLGQYKKSIKEYNSCIEYATGAGYSDLVRQAYKGLADVLGKNGDYRMAFISLNNYNRITDSLFNIQKISQASKLEEDAKFNKQQLVIISKEEELLKRKVRINQQKQIQILLYIIIVLFFGIIIFSTREFSHKKKANQQLKQQKEELEYQKNLAEKRTRGFTDSLNYARRIQQAMLRASLKIKSYFPESFLILFPCDIVSGDFYWVKEKNNKIFFALADCTGHGVPGAFMSIIGTYGLNRLVSEMNLSYPSEILNQINSLFEDSLEQQEGVEIYDGMDIGLCSYSKKTKEMNYAGANIPLFILRKIELPQAASTIAAKSQTHTLYIVRPNKQPIGSYFDRKPFINHSINLLDGDIVYLFSDGFADQFGGPDGRKFKSNQVHKLLCTIGDLSLDEQKEILENTFVKWKGKRKQVDDMSFMAVKI